MPRTAPGVQPVQLLVKLGSELLPLSGETSIYGPYTVGNFMPAPIIGFDPPTLNDIFSPNVQPIATDGLIAGTDPVRRVLSVAGYNYGYNGTGFDRLRTASAGNLNPAAVAPVGMLLETRPGQWSQAHEPAVNVQATTTKAAGAAGVVHVCTGIAGVLCAVNAVAAPLYLQLRDGATGAGTVKWSAAVIAPAGTSVPFVLSGLNIVGTAATAMTLEFSAAPGAGNFETVALSGYSVAA